MSNAISPRIEQESPNDSLLYQREILPPPLSQRERPRKVRKRGDLITVEQFYNLVEDGQKADLVELLFTEPLPKSYEILQKMGKVKRDA